MWVLCKFKSRKDLEITYSDEDNEFQCSWFELVNEKRPNILVGVIDIINNNAPIITLSRKESKLRQKPWLTKGIIESIRIKNQLYKNTLKSKIVSGFKDISSIETRSIC